MSHHFNIPHKVKIEEVPHSKADCPTHYLPGHKEEGKQKKEKIRADCTFINHSITKALDSLNGDEINTALNKFVAAGTPSSTVIGKIYLCIKIVLLF